MINAVQVLETTECIMYHCVLVFLETQGLQADIIVYLSESTAE